MNPSPRRSLEKPLALGPGSLWLTLFLVLPLLCLVAVSFFSRGSYGELEMPLTFESYKRLAGFGSFGFEPLYPGIMARSLFMAAAATALCLVAALPLAFFIARLSPRAKLVALTLVVVPFWTNLLIRTYAWQILLSPGGWLARLFAAAGLVTPGEPLYPGSAAVYLCLVCDYLPFTVLPLYASVEKLDWTLVEAASDLGARGWACFRHAILPQIKPGLIAGGALVFLPATGQFVIPDLLGGAKSILLGNILQQQFGASRDWPFGSAIAVVSLVVVLAGIALYRRSARSEGEDLL